MLFRSFLIGIDAAVVVGNAEVMTTGLILIPLTIGLAFILPGNHLLPFADLAVVPFRIALVVALTGGNLFRSLVIGIAVMSAILLAGTNTSQALTALASSSGINLSMAAGALISTFAGTSLTVSFIIYEVFIGNLVITVPLFIIGFAAIWIYMGRKEKKIKSVPLEEGAKLN